MAHSAELVEAVIISGKRRGEIVRFQRKQQESLSSKEIDALDAGLDKLIAAIERLDKGIQLVTESVEREVKSTSETIQKEVRETVRVIRRPLIRAEVS